MSVSITFNTSRLFLNRAIKNAPTILGSRFSAPHPVIYQTQNLHRKSIYKREEAKKLRFYFLNRSVEYIKNYDKVIEKNFPATMQTYRVFTDGFKAFLSDTKYYFKIVGLMYTPGNNFHKLLRREIELYDQMPKDMRKVLPVLILTPLPFGFYVILPLIYTFPKYLLSAHFWTLQQKSKFNVEYLTNRLTHNKAVFRHLQSQLDFLKGSKLHESWATVLGKLGSGLHPSVEEILVCKELFSALPYNLYYLSRNHVRIIILIEIGNFYSKTMVWSLKEVWDDFKLMIKLKLEDMYPAPFEKYRAFLDGCYNFAVDTKRYFFVKDLLSKSNYKFDVLPRKEIELYHQFPKDLKKVAPTLLLASLPVVFYFIMPIIFIFPKQTLSQQFWPATEREAFLLEYLRNRLLSYKPVLQKLKQCRKEEFNSEELYTSWIDMIRAMEGSPWHPSPEQIMAHRTVFAKPYALAVLSSRHIKHLIKMHDLHSGWFRRTRLADRARILIEMDRAIMREGGVHNLPVEALRNACYIRGLNPTNMKTEDMVQWLTKWIQISSKIDKDNASLLLHCPILLGYNEPSNWRLIYPTKEP